LYFSPRAWFSAMASSRETSRRTKGSSAAMIRRISASIAAKSSVESCFAGTSMS
jgi:hypothetical protein